jgi:hypothetical protein
MLSTGPPLLSVFNENDLRLVISSRSSSGRLRSSSVRGPYAEPELRRDGDVATEGQERLADTRSFGNGPYTCAVSKGVTPRSTAAITIATDVTEAGQV